MIACRTLLVDDSRQFLRAAEHFLAGVPGVEVVGRASSGRGAVTLTQRLHPDLVLIDLAMPRMNGLDATRLLKAMPACPRVILLTMHDNPEYQAAAAAAGADGLVLKQEFATHLPALLQALSNQSGQMRYFFTLASSTRTPSPGASGTVR